MSFFGMFEEPENLRSHPGLRAPSTDDTYRAILKDLSAKQRNRVIENDTFDDSVAVFERFFLDCTDEVRIMARGIKAQILDRSPVLLAVRKFLNRPHTKIRLDLRAQSQNDIDVAIGSEFVRTIQQETADSGRFLARFYRSEPEEEWLPKIASVALGDDRMYRVRRARADNDYRTTASADVNFGDPERVGRLTKRIDEALKEEPIFKEVIY